ncbi:TPA: phage baseplate assembly protein V [Burkholderia vietnamiensis]|uniref:phage baseplate assembly protein V n=1 Tax=Burkholderia vietnamiensis TaxID=60552 RepID=UPI001B9FF081|nr:phage baseplate assembly protein V [Burkholderia vietnamiensis]MBR7908594.1 phage baseplate assembly protein V [Burkholderia vietnamiensis]HDR9048585.1 phage baseplate assembly protein V [Burkholderia vietnamiensis]HDR9231842.1 phage baseplate assembly protein V [Burkholderia vietnamiensis]HDR9272418.1 phage baseplate assembly protein V [Burkholderia vietnamiensis]
MDANEIQRQARNAVRKGSILDIDHAKGLCRVSVGDPDENGDGLQTNWIPWLALAAGTTRDWLPPTKGEQVVLLCPMGDPAQGVALCGIYSDAAPAPSASADTHTRIYPDGAVIEYDHAAHSLKAELPAGATMLIVAPGSVTVQTKDATVQADNILLDGDATVTKSLTVKGPLSFESGMTGKGGKGGATMQIDGGAQFTQDVTAAGVSVANHPHMAQGANALTSKPVKGAA